MKKYIKKIKLQKNEKYKFRKNEFMEKMNISKKKRNENKNSKTSKKLNL